MYMSSNLVIEAISSSFQSILDLFLKVFANNVSVKKEFKML